MIIKKLQLHNFGVYAGNHTFLFEGKKPVVLIGGMNGGGKTTFLEAVLLALYGSSSYAYLESGQKSYSQYLRSFVNRGAEDQTCSVELGFELDRGVRENYIVKREWDAIGKRTKDRIQIIKNGIFNEFLTDNWPMFIENILPSALSSFFFFDGEKIAELAVDKTSIRLKNSIRSMLGISVLDVLENDIVRNLRKIDKTGDENKTAEEVQELRDEKKKSIVELAKVDAQIEALNCKLMEDKNQVEFLQQLYVTKGGEADERRHETMQKRAALIAELSGEENRLYELIAAELPFVLVRDFIKDIKLQATDEHADMVMQQAIFQLDGIYEDFAAEYTGDQQAGRDFIEYVRKQAKGNRTDLVYRLSDQALFQTNNLVESIMINVEEETRKILEKKKKLEKQIEEFDSYLTLDLNEQELQDIRNRIKEAEQIVFDDQMKLSELDQKRVAANAKVIAVTAEFDRAVESYLLSVELKDHNDRTIKYSNIALSIIEKYRVALQKRKTDVLADTITRCYLKLANKKNLIKKIVMDPETLDMQYLSEDGTLILKDSLSAGEQQLMVISILWALGICSKKKLPVIIDTPLSRLDSVHRTTLINTYFPNAGEQTIILSTDSEINSEYYDLMKESIGDEFTLCYHEETQSTSIERGFMIGVGV